MRTTGWLKSRHCAAELNDNWRIFLTDYVCEDQRAGMHEEESFFSLFPALIEYAYQ